MKIQWIFSCVLTVCVFSLSAMVQADDGLESDFMAGDDSSRVFGGEKVDVNNPLNDKVLYLAQNVVISGANKGKIRWRGHCTASALSKRVVLTAAHCVDQEPLGEIYINTTRNDDAKGMYLKNWYRVQKIKIHPKYHSGQGKESHDLALLYLEKDLPHKHILKMATPTMVEVPSRFLTIGFGRTVALSSPQAIDQAPKGLHLVEKVLMDFSFLQKTFFLTQSDLKGFCKGDSGGPGLIQDSLTGEFFILGVASFVSMSASEKEQLDPHNQYTLCIGKGHYTNVAYPSFSRWIHNEMHKPKPDFLF